MAPEKARVMSRRRSVLVWSLLGLSTLVLVIGSLTVWSKRQLLDTDNFTESSGKLLANDEIRSTLSARLVDLIDERVDPDKLQDRLPPATQSAAPVIAAAIPIAAGRVIDAFLATPQAQALWEQVVRRSHTALVNVLEGNDAGPVSTVNGDVVLDLRPFIERIATRLGIEDRLANASPTAGEVVIFKSDQLDTAQTAVRVLNALSSWIALAVLVLFALAVYIARGRRRETLMRVGWCLLFVGLLLVVIRRVVGGAVVDSVVQVESSKPAANAVWLITTDLLRDVAIALFFYGLLAVLAAFVAGPSRRAIWLRRKLAPTFRERPVLVYLVAFFVFLLVLAWGPTAGSRRLLGVVILAALVGLGIELWRRQTLRDFPEGSAAEVETPAATDQLDGLERLARLRSSGALTESEFEAQKAALLGT